MISKVSDIDYKTTLEYRTYYNNSEQEMKAIIFVQRKAYYPSFYADVLCDKNGIAEKDSLVQALRGLADLLEKKE